MERRHFVLTSLAAAVAAPFAAEAQPPGNAYRIGYLSRSNGSAESRTVRNAFLDELRALGYTGGANLIVEWKWAGGRVDLLPNMADELVRARVQLIVAPGMNSRPNSSL